MRSGSLTLLIAFASGLAKASPVAIPEILDLVKRTGNEGTEFYDYHPDCSDDPSFASGTSQYQDGSGLKCHLSLQ